jgi:hypothetical protein
VCPRRRTAPPDARRAGPRPGPAVQSEASAPYSLATPICSTRQGTGMGARGCRATGHNGVARTIAASPRPRTRDAGSAVPAVARSRIDQRRGQHVQPAQRGVATVGVGGGVGVNRWLVPVPKSTMSTMCAGIGTRARARRSASLCLAMVPRLSGGAALRRRGRTGNSARWPRRPPTRTPSGGTGAHKRPRLRRASWRGPRGQAAHAQALR